MQLPDLKGLFLLAKRTSARPCTLYVAPFDEQKPASGVSCGG